MYTFLKNFKFKRNCLVYFVTLEAVINVSNTDNNLVASLETENRIRNDRFEDLISEILVGEAPVNDFVIHYDSTSSEFIDRIILKTNAKKKMIIKPKNVIITVNASHPATIVTVNYDIRGEVMYNISGKRFTIHVISLKSPLEFDDFYLNSLKSSDVIIMICQKHYGTCESAFDRGSNIDALDRFFLKKFKFLDRVLFTVVIEVLDHRVRLYEICYYCGTAAGKLIQKHEIDLTTEMFYNDIDLYSKLMGILKFETWDFNSHIFKVGFPYNEVSFGCRNPQETGTNNQDEFEVSCDELYSLEGNMLSEVQKRLNLKVKLLTFRSIDDNDVTDKMINKTRKHRADWSIGSISVTAFRINKVHFSFPVSEDPVKIIYSTEDGFLKDGFRMFHVFSVYIWMLIIFTLIVQSAVVYTSNRKAGQNKKKISDIVWALGFMLTEQPLQINWKLLGGRVLVAWVMCSISISTLLKAQMTSFITKPLTKPSVKFEELVTGDFQFNLINAHTGFLSEMLKSSSDTLLQELSHRMIPRTDICLTFKDMIGKTAMLFEELDLVYNELNVRCRSYLTSEDILSLRITRDNVFPLVHAWAFPIKAPYINFVNNQIMLYHQYGLQKKWSDNLRVPPGNLSVYFDGVTIVDQSRLIPKKLKGFSHLVLWIFGVGLSLLCFMSEIVLYAFRRKEDKEWIAINANKSSL